MPTEISATEAAKILGLKYHTFVYWIKANRFGMGDHSRKIGHAWIVEKEHVESLDRLVKERAGTKE